jgi:hypothetical protein
MKVVIVVTCQSCGEEQPPIEITHPQLFLWNRGEHIQRAMPDLTAEQRELLISATCGKCWDKMFGEEDDE